MGKERFSERQAAVLNAAARLDEVAALPETDIVRDAAIQRFELVHVLLRLRAFAHMCDALRPDPFCPYEPGVASSTLG